MTRTFRIVAADDEPFVLHYYESILPHLGHEVVGTAADGEQLVQVALQQQPDLVITDLKMPKMDGVDASVEISAARPTPVIVVTGHYQEEAVERAVGNHVMAFLVKPVKLQELQAAVILAVDNFEKRFPQSEVS